MRIYQALFCCVGLWGGAATASEVVGIVDGDTLDAIIGGKQQRVRVAQIDAPERGQPFAKASKEALSDLAYGKDCDITPVGDERDRYGRIVGQITCGGLDVNRQMVRLGFAWVYKKYLSDASLLEDEAAARKRLAGLWADPNPVPPWEWRKAKH